MKDLTHYFNSPKEEESDHKVNINKTESHIEIVEENAPCKKRKISLSKSKKKKSESQENKKLSPVNSNNVCEAQNKRKEPLNEELVGKKVKKRKMNDDFNSSQKKIKTSKSLRISLKKCDSKGNGSHEVAVVLEATQSESDEKTNMSRAHQTENKLFTFLENSVSSDEPLVRPNRRSKKNILLDSDDETQSIENQSPPSTEKLENEKNADTTSRNSLFSYFNKVDKVTALKQQKSGKIEVKAIVHLSPNGDKIETKSLDKRHLTNKMKKQKNKSQLDDSDTIEVISSEDVVYESSSTIANVPRETEQIRVSSSSSSGEGVKPKPSNLASIFIPKKTGQLSKAVENICSPKSEKDITQVVKNEKVQSEELTKPSKQKKALSKSKKSLKTNKGVKLEKSASKKLLDHDTEDNSDIENTQEKEIQVVLVDKKPTLKRNGILKTSTNVKKGYAGKLNSPTSEESKEKKLHNVESPTVVKSIKNLKNSDGKTQEKLKSTINVETTPKKERLAINGFFTPKSNKLTSNNAVSSEKKAPKSARSSWVMKVCLSASKKMNDDSEDDYQEDSQDSITVENETASNCLKVSDEEIEDNKADPPIIVIDEDENSSTADNKDDDNIRRRSLPRNAKKPKQKILEEEGEEDVVEVKPQTPKPPVKMWPFFQKGGARTPKKAPVDEAKLKAKMLFLESGVPEIIKRKVETVKSDLVLGSPAPFPTISHVMQDKEKASCVGVGLPLPPARSVSPSPVLPAWTPLVSTNSPEEPEIPVFERPGNVKAFLEKLKEEETKTEVKVLYKKLKEYKSKAESDIWTEVYNPTNSADMVGNSENIKKLKTWLETLKNCRKREGSVSSGDEFVSEDSDGGDDSFNNMAMICGPCGCGKTSAVYAIAKELDIKVLEINASCNRSGKRILAEFSESTQSHHVERSQPVNGFFNNQSSGKKKRKKSKTPNELKSEKTSLILVEDADLLFTDCDEGFVPSLASLATSSKRPIVLITNQAHTPHLDRFNNVKLLTLTFNRPRANKLSLWLRLIGLVEGVMMTPELALRLVTQSNCDVRRCLLQLQLMVHSNNSEVKEELSPSGLWWRWPAGHKLSYELPTLLEPEEGEPRLEADKKLLLRQLESVSDTTRRLAHLDVLALNSRTECVEDHEDPCPVAWRPRWRDSTALTVPSASDLCLGPEANWLQQALAASQDHSLGLSHRSGQTSQEAKWLSVLRQGEQLYMSGISFTSHTSHQSVTCDYLPTLRELGRSEQVRLANYTRRANRFFNYLQGLGIHASKSYRDFMSDAFS